MSSGWGRVWMVAMATALLTGCGHSVVGAGVGGGAAGTAAFANAPTSRLATAPHNGASQHAAPAGARSALGCASQPTTRDRAVAAVGKGDGAWGVLLSATGHPCALPGGSVPIALPGGAAPIDHWMKQDPAAPSMKDMAEHAVDLMKEATGDDAIELKKVEAVDTRVTNGFLYRMVLSVRSSLGDVHAYTMVYEDYQGALKLFPYMK